MTLNQFWALPVRRAGAPLPRWQQSQGAWRRGNLVVGEEKDKILGRHVIVARFINDDREAELLPKLIEARLIHVSAERIILTGVERDDLTRCDTAQTWLLVRGASAPQGAGVLAT